MDRHNAPVIDKVAVHSKVMSLMAETRCHLTVSREPLELLLVLFCLRRLQCYIVPALHTPTEVTSNLMSSNNTPRARVACASDDHHNPRVYLLLDIWSWRCARTTFFQLRYLIAATKH